MIRALSLLLPALLALAGCRREETAAPAMTGASPPLPFLGSPLRVTEHREGDDLASAGLGLEGLRAPPPAPADPSRPSAAELRRLAIHHNLRGIADLRPGQYGEGYARLARVPGREYHALARVPGARQPHRVMAQVPDGFDHARRCLVLAPVSGSRGIYGAQALAAIALARGCAVASTDKGAGSDVFDLAADEGAALDGTRARRGEAPLAFEPPPQPGREPLIALKHAHSGDHPEADWGRHALQAAAFGLHALGLAFPELAPFTPENTRILGLGVSNGAAALVHALEQDREGIFDGAVLGAPNLAVPGRPALYEYATLAALLQPCLLADPAAAAAPFARGNPLLAAAAALRCAELQRRGLLPPGPPAAAAAAARAELLAAGFDEPSLRLAAMNVALDLWRTVAVSYASAYLRRGPAAMPCGYRIAVLAAPGLARPATPGERALWWASANGLAPSGEIGLLDARAAPPDPFLPGLLCLRELATGEGEEARALREAVAATRVSGRLPPVPVILIHGREDALIPAALSSRPYAELARASGARLDYRELPEVQHFDAFLAHPELAGFRPLLPELERALDELLAPR